VFIDTVKKIISKFVIYPDQDLCARYRFTYQYYPLYKINKLLFLSKDLQCLMIVDMNKVEHFIRSDYTEKCKELSIKNIEDTKENFPNIEKISIILNIKQVIIKAIKDMHKIEVESGSLEILDHIVNKNTTSLYIIAKYIIYGLENIAVFLLNILNDSSEIKLSYFITKHPKNPAIGLYNGKYSYFKFISLLNLYKLSFIRINLSNLDIFYNDAGAFVSIKYNRTSYTFIKGHYEKEKLFIDGLDNLIIMKYKCKYIGNIESTGREYAEVSCHSSYAFSLCDLALVRKMPAVLM
jgi:hypothetical protein